MGGGIYAIRELLAMIVNPRALESTRLRRLVDGNNPPPQSLFRGAGGEGGGGGRGLHNRL